MQPQEFLFSACRHVGHPWGWVGSGWEYRVAPCKPASSPGLAQSSLLTPFLPEKAKMDENVWGL